MDPDAALADLRELVNQHGEGHELAAAFADLDEWLSKGGFLPEAWERNERNDDDGGQEPLQLLRIREVAYLLSFSESTIRRMIRAGEIRSVRSRGAVRVPRAAVDEYVAELEAVARASR